MFQSVTKFELCDLWALDRESATAGLVPAETESKQN